MALCCTGLGGELRSVSHVERRVLEAAKLGYSKMIVPTASKLQSKGRLQGIDIVPCRTIRDAVQAVLGRNLMSPTSLRQAARAAKKASKEAELSQLPEGYTPAVAGWPEEAVG